MPTESNVLVTGASGFVGRRLVERLLQGGASLRILQQETQPVPDRWRSLADIRSGDVLEPETLPDVVAGIEAVYHLAGEIRRPDLFDAVNRQGTQNLLDVCETHGVKRFIYMSSVGVIEPARNSGPARHSARGRAQGGYEKSKAEGETLALGRNREGRMKVVSLRPSIIYGEDRPAQGDSFHSLVRLIASGKFALFGRQYFNSYVYVGDVAEAAVFVNEHPRTGGQAYIINEPIALEDFVQEIARLLGRRPIQTLPRAWGRLAEKVLRARGRYGSLYNRVPYDIKALSDIGFQMPFGYKIGLARTLAWYKAQQRLQ